MDRMQKMAVDQMAVAAFAEAYEGGAVTIVQAEKSAAAVVVERLGHHGPAFVNRGKRSVAHAADAAAERQQANRSHVAHYL